MHAALAELPEEQRQLFVWHELDGLSFQDIAALTGDDVNTLLSRKRYAVPRCVANYDKTCFALQDDGSYPIGLLDTKTPYQLATQWLASLSIDVKGLNHDSKPRVELSPFWNGLSKLGQKPKKSFVPIYFVWWKPKSEDGAYVELFLPKKMLIQLSVEDPKYILRKELVFTNLAALFPGTALITSNGPVKPQLIPPPGTH